MSIRRRASALLLSILLAASVASAVPARAATPSGPWVRFVPARVLTGRVATITGGHLRPNSYFALLLAIPNMKHHRLERLFGPVKTNGKGYLHSAVIMPVVTRCGAAYVYASLFRSQRYVRTRVTLIGCKASKQGKVPPPPSPGKKQP